MNLKLSKAKPADSLFFYKLRNDTNNRKKFIHSKKINFNHHDKWFKNSIKKKLNIFYKIIVNKNHGCGYLRLKENKSSFDVSICIDKKFRKKNIASEAILCAEKKLKNRKNFTSVIKKNNNASKLMFLKVGYSITKKNKKFIHMKKKVGSIKIINKIETIRKKNNSNWMDLLRLAYKRSPKESAKIMSKIYRDDAEISKLVKKLVKN